MRHKRLLARLLVDASPGFTSALRPGIIRTVANGNGVLRDYANDLGMLGLAGAGVALHAKPVVSEQCDIRVNHGDLTALLFLQGYSRAEFLS